MTALAGKSADVFVTSTPSVAVTANTVYNDISANVGGSGAANEYPALTCWASSIAAQRYLDPTVVPQFQTSADGVTWNNATPDHIEPGFVRWNSALTATPHVRISSGSYLPYAHMAGSNEWTMTPSIGMADITEFGQSARTRKVTLLDTTVSIKKFWVDDTLRATMGNLLILALYVNAAGQPAGPRYECFAYLKDEQLKAAVAGIIENTLNFQVHAAGNTNSVWFLNN